MRKQTSASPADGTVRIPAFTLPPSPGWSPQAQRVFQRRLEATPVSARSVAQTGELTEAEWVRSAAEFRASMSHLHRTLLDRVIEPRFPVRVTDEEIAGVHVQVVEPPDGPSAVHADALLINLHGGAFVGGAEYCGLVESIPLASLGGYRVVVVDYRQGWEHRYPAASEDVAAVYRALLSTYSADRIGIFGYSAGGSLTAQVLAWFIEHNIQLPAAAALCCAGAGGAGAGGDGDATHWAAVAMGGAPADVDTPDAGSRFGYFAGIERTARLAAPMYDAGLLARFPPTLLMSGTRSFDLSAVAMTHRALLEAGASAELHVWEGMWHCFPYNANMPEAQEAFDCLLGFFERHLARQ
jgi:acetyl esterase/lipase